MVLKVLVLGGTGPAGICLLREYTIFFEFPFLVSVTRNLQYAFFYLF